MANLKEIISLLDSTLNTIAFQDYPGAYNGLQLECESDITRVACAVDASLPVIEKAIANNSQLLIVHHGLFWQSERKITGYRFKKFKTAIEAGLAIYSSHLPLDYHPKYGNNLLLAQSLKLENLKIFSDHQNKPLGTESNAPIDRNQLQHSLSELFPNDVNACIAGPAQCHKVAIMTGAAGSMIQEIHDLGFDTLITGEGPHWSYCLAEELEMNLFYAGHYNTETFGVKAICQLLTQHFPIDSVFIDHPTGL